MLADQLYSVTLLVALTAAGLAAAGSVGLLCRPLSPVLGRRLGATARIGGLAALAFGLLSLGVHVAFGHRPGTAEALGPVAFFEIHPVYLVVFTVAAGAIFLARYVTRKG